MLKKKLVVLFLILAFGLGCVQGATFAPSASFDIKVENLAWYNALLEAKKVVAHNYATQEQGENYHEELALINKNIELLKEIIVLFNKGNYFFLQLKFTALCNLFKKGESIEPHDLRRFQEKLERFDEYIKKCLTERQSFMSKDELELCNKLCQFDEIILNGLLEYKYFDIDVFDQVVDWVWYRPIEAVRAHPVVAAGVIVPLAVGAGMLLGKQAFRDYYFTPITVDGRTMCMEPSVEAQSQAMCGKHALMNVACQIQPATDREAKNQEWGCFITDKSISELPGRIEGVKRNIERNLGGKHDVKDVEDEDTKKQITSQLQTATRLEKLLQFAVKSASESTQINMLNDLEGTEIEWIRDEEIRKKGAWRNVYIVPDIADVGRYSQLLNQEYVQQQFTIAERCVDALHSATLVNGSDPFKAAANDSLENQKLNGEVWKNIVGPIVCGNKDRSNLTSDAVSKALLQDISGRDGMFPGLKEKLQRGETVYYIINVGTGVDKDGAFVGGYGHWIACRDDANGFFIRDSVGYYNYVHHKDLQTLCRFGGRFRTR